jgi:hypothetical protein
MTPTNRMSAEQARAYRANLHAPSAAKPKAKPRDKRLIAQLCEHRSDEPGVTVHIVEVPCFLPTANGLIGMYKHGQSWKVDKFKSQATRNMLGCLARALPSFCVDDAYERGSARRLRDGVRWVRFIRIGTRKADKHDNVPMACKYVCDAFCGWLVDGPLIDFEHIGSYDDMVHDDEDNPTGRLRVSYGQDIRSSGFGLRLEFHHHS